ncbi:MAG: glycoside hydrolase family 3 protein [Treponema sp.]|jgi:beta-N-acetylhexosaminidase|nr:glycoside hydrolase family 3 protein [Treponema sp.]
MKAATPKTGAILPVYAGAVCAGVCAAICGAICGALLLVVACSKNASLGMAGSEDAGVDRISYEKAEWDEFFQRNLQKASDIVRLMTDEQLAAQVIMAGIDACGPLSEGERKRLRRVPAGAIALFRKNLNAGSPAIIEMTEELAALGPVLTMPDGTSGRRIKPFIAVDHEGGDVYRFNEASVARLPAPLSYWELENGPAALRAIEQDAAESAKEIAALGITMNLAPLAETLTDENRDFLGTRSYGPDPDFTAKAAAAFIRGMKAASVSCVVKHFPGNAGVDPHIATPRLSGGEHELNAAIEPFAALIDGDPPSGVMVSHVIVPAWDSAQNASLSEFVMQKKLRGELDFRGIIIADDFSMGAVSGGYDTEEKTVMALRAGADMVMAWPRNLVSIHNAILAALSDGSLPRERLQAAAARVISEKLRMESDTH